MQVTVNDSGTLIEAEVDDDRHEAIDAAVRQLAPQIGITPSGGAEFNRRTARDAGEALAFVVSQLAYTEQKLFEKKYIPTQAEQLIPMDTSAGEHVQSIRYEEYDQSGQAIDVTGYGDDIPLVEVAYAEKTFAVPLGAVGYGFTNEELRVSAFLRKPLNVQRLKAAMATYNRRINSVGLLGNALKGLTGLYNNGSVSHAVRPSGQSWNASNVAGTPEKIVSDLNFGLQTAWAANAYSDVPDHIVVAPAGYAELQKPRATYSDKSILQWFKENNLCKDQTGKDLVIMPGYQLDTAGSGGATRALFYSRSDENLVMHIPMGLKFGAPQLRGLGVFVFGEFKYSGVEIRRPTTVYYMDGV